ncbi:MAG: porphobilinogen synthase [Candidatus Omnitrophica bacterium]|nr:porphobilinogen synthase [Candidatus Omnitrophota bacterium]
MSNFRRLRQSPTIRELVRETHLTKNDVIQPFFVIEGNKKIETIPSMPGIHRYSSDLLLREIEDYIKGGGKAGLFFGLPGKKDAKASQAYSEKGVIQNAIRKIKKEFPEFLVITDVCLCAYMDHGHCGVIENDKIVNEKTLPLLCKVALSHAEAGADIIAPSDMMDMRVGEIRRALDAQNFRNTAILSYAVKYSSAYYGPFRDAANSAPAFGDRKTYQMDPANAREALKEAQQDVLEGADMVMIKPAVAYLDIIHRVREAVNVPIAAYHVSGEYSMIKAAAEKKWINERDVALETLLGIKRAGADLIITYYAKDILKWI